MTGNPRRKEAGRKDMPGSGRPPGSTYPAVAARAADAEPGAGGRGSGGGFADVLPNCCRAQITASLLPYMYRRWHLGRGPGEPPPARGMCTFSGIAKGQGAHDASALQGAVEEKQPGGDFRDFCEVKDQPEG